MTSEFNFRKYCVYLTIYKGSKLPMFYIGSTSVAKVEGGYHGSVSSRKYSTIYKEELKHNPDLFKTIIFKRYDTREEALARELYFHRCLNVVKSTMYINLTVAAPGGFCGRIVAGADNPNYGKRWNQEQRQAASLRYKTTIHKPRKPRSLETQQRASKKTARANKNKIVVRGSDGIIKRITTDEYNADCTLVHHTKGTKTVLISSTGEKVRIKIDDYDPSTQTNNTSKYRHYKNVDGLSFTVQHDDPRVLSGELVMFSKGTIPVRDAEGNKFRVPKDDPRYLSGELVHQTKGTATAFNAATGESIGRVNCDDPRWKRGSIIGAKSLRRLLITPCGQDSNPLTLTI